MTPVCQQFWKDELATHHDPDFVGWVLRGLQEGFRIGFDDTIVDLSSAHSNMSSPGGGVSVHSEGGIGGTPATNRPIRRCLALQDSYQPAGVIPKRGRPDQWRLIMDLSSPHGHSVNDAISVELCSLHYTLVNDAVTQLRKVGHGAACKNG